MALEFGDRERTLLSEKNSKNSAYAEKIVVDTAQEAGEMLRVGNERSLLKLKESNADTKTLHQESNGNEFQTNRSGGMQKTAVHKVQEVTGKTLRVRKQRSVLNQTESAANARMLHQDVHNNKLHATYSGKLRTKQRKNLRIEQGEKFQTVETVHMITDKAGKDYTGRRSITPERYSEQISHNANRMARTESKLQKKMQGRYRRDMAIKGGVASPLRVETTMKSKLRPSELTESIKDTGNKAHNVLRFTNEQLDSDSLGIQKAWTDSADKSISTIKGVYRVSKQAKNFRAMRKEKEIAKLLRREDKIAKATFKAEYKQAYEAFKNSQLGQESSFLLKQKQKRFLKKKYMKNAMKQYQQAKKAGEAAKVAYSTGLSVADKAKSLVQNIVRILRDSKAWIVLLGLLALLILPSIISALLTLFMGIFGGESSKQTIPVGGYPEAVEQWRDFVVERCEANNDTSSGTDLTLFVNAILTTIWQESGGNPDTCGGDIMQCKACGLWDDSKMPEEWTEAQKSIDVGIRYFYTGLKSWGVTKSDDYDGLQIVAQGYNYGFAFLTWMKKTKGADKWTLELSTEYSNMKAQAAGWTSYGHKPYGKEWLEKYMQGLAGGSGEVVNEKGVQGVIKTAQNQVGITENPAGSNNVIYNTDFYGVEVSGDKYPWCCAFVWWCFDKSGNGAAFYNGGKTAGCAEVASWATNNSLWINKSDVVAGDLVLFKGGDTGWSHIEIVTSVEGNTINTIGGNTTPESGSGDDYNGGAVAVRHRTYSNTTHYFVRPQWSKLGSED